jgi:mannan endo-1,4-beta-mannosidase
MAKRKLSFPGSGHIWVQMKAAFIPLLLFSLPCLAGDFVRVTPTGLERQGRPYRFVGANFWAGMNLGSSGQAGDRKRLLRELDRMQSLGISNLRIMGATEGPDSEPWRIVPALQPQPGSFRDELLEGLDFLMSEIGRRGMTAVVCLGDFWPWSGGFSQLLNWSGAGTIPYPPPAAGGDWSVYQNFTQQFYSNEQAMNLYRETIRKIVARTNSITHVVYKDDPAILSWELANEPRGIQNVVLFNFWLDQSSTFIKSLDPNHLVTTGSEGETPWPETAGLDFLANHSHSAIDYATIHIWAGNWGWYDPAHAQATFGDAVAKMKSYFQDHLAKARRLGKPLVVEEFGLARDGGSFDPESATSYRDRYYAEVFEQVAQAQAAGAPVAGVNFWAWAGEARPNKPYGGYWHAGDPFLGDPPHEAQGWYSVYDRDASTLQVISRYARKVRSDTFQDQANAGRIKSWLKSGPPSHSRHSLRSS